MTCVIQPLLAAMRCACCVSTRWRLAASGAGWPTAHAAAATQLAECMSGGALLLQHTPAHTRIPGHSCKPRRRQQGFVLGVRLDSVAPVF